MTGKQKRAEIWQYATNTYIMEDISITMKIAE